MNSLVTAKMSSLSVLLFLITVTDSLCAPPDNNAMTTTGDHLLKKQEFPLGIIKGRGKARSVAFSPDGRFVAAAFADGKAHVWKIAASEKLQSENLARLEIPTGRRKMIRAITISPDGKSIVTGNDDCTIRFLQLAPGCKEIHRFAHGKPPTEFLSYCQEGRILVSWDGINTIRVWQPEKEKELRTLSLDQSINALAGSPRKAEVVIAISNAIIILDVTDGRRIGHIECDPESVEHLAYSQDGRMLAVAKGSWTEIYETASNKLVAAMRLISGGKVSKINTLCFFSTDNRLLATSDTGGIILICDLVTGKIHSDQLTEDAVTISAMSYLPHEELLAFGSFDSTRFVWKINKLFSGPGLHAMKKYTVVGNMPKQPSQEDCQSLWNDLHEKDAKIAYKALWNFVACQNKAVPFLDRNLQPVTPIDSEYIIELVNDLDNDSFQVRENASEKLKKIGDLAVPILRRRYQGSKSSEFSRRIKEILDHSYPFSQDHLRILRAIQILEYIGTPDAILVLDRLSKGASESSITREAKSSVLHLTKRKAVKQR